MKITDLRAHLLTAQWTDDPWFPQMLHSTAVIRVETDAGLDGLGEATLGYFAPETVLPLVDYFRPILVGKDPLEISRLIEAMRTDSIWWARSGSGCSVISGIELALWDLRGKAFNVPVYQLLGGKARDTIPVYASGGASCWPIEETVRKVDYYRQCGHRAAKLSTDFYRLELDPKAQHQGRLEPIRLPFSQQISTLALCFDRLRKECGPDFDLAVDGHQSGVPNPISVSESIATAEALAEFRVRFYEEPLAYSNVEGYRELRARSPVPIAGGESLCGLDQFHPFIEGRALDFVQPDIGFVGGLRESERIIHHAEAHNLGTAIHTGASMGPSFAASWHLAAAYGSVAWLEEVVAARSIQRDLLIDRFEVNDGQVRLPSSPGLGVRLTQELIEKYRFVPNSGERT